AELHTRTLRARAEALSGQQDACLHHLVVVLAHDFEGFCLGHRARFRFLRCLADDHETHWSLVNGVRVRWRPFSASLTRRMTRAKIDTELRESSQAVGFKALGADA